MKRALCYHHGRESNSAREGRTQEILVTQVTTENLRRVFNVSLSEVWLQDELDGTVFFPEDGSFVLMNISSISVLIIEGPSFQATPRSSSYPSRSSGVTISSLPSSSNILPPASILPPPTFCSVTAPRRSLSFTLKVIKVRIIRKNGRHKLDIESDAKQTFIELVKSTANLEYILPIYRDVGGLNIA